MKLIDILVQELPKRGGWPEGASIISMHADGMVFINKARTFDLPLPQCSDGWDGNKHASNYTNEVTREQYEAALKQPVWNGTGLPPVGVECEGKQFAQLNWTKFKVVAVENGHVFGFWNDSVSAGLDSQHWEFRPIRSERDKIGEEIYRVINWNHEGDIKRNSRFDDYCRVYDAIAAGKITGVKLSD